MSEPKENIKPLDMTSVEAVNFLFPKDAIDAMKQVANPDKQRAKAKDEDCDDESYLQDSK